MDPKKIALLIGALVMAALTAVLAKNMLTQQATPVAGAQLAGPPGPEVLVATRPLPVGTIITPDSFRFQPWPRDLIENAYYIKNSVDQNSLSGTVVRTQISAGQPLTQGSLVKAGDRGFLAAALGPGMRAVTVTVSRDTGVGGFVFPGDRVDLMLTQTVDGSNGPALKTTETFIRNLRVLATDQRTVSDDVNGKKEVVLFDTVTLEVTPRLAEKIAVAQTIGQLGLSLRSIADNAADLDLAIASGEVKVPKGADPKDRVSLINIAARPNDTNTTYVTGADVSRFQRKTVPVPAGNAGSGNGGGGYMNSGSAQAAAAGRPNVGAPVGDAGGASGVVRGPTVRVVRGIVETEVSVRAGK